MSGDGKFSEERVRRGTVQKEMLHTVQRKQVVEQVMEWRMAMSYSRELSGEILQGIEELALPENYFPGRKRGRV